MDDEIAIANDQQREYEEVQRIAKLAQEGIERMKSPNPFKWTRLVFLDIDGVLVLATSRQQPVPDAIEQLNRLTGATAAYIVVTSTWRRMGYTALQQQFKDWGIKGKMFSITPDLPDSERGQEIAWWLDDNFSQRDEVEFVILDDDADMDPFMHRLIQTDPRVGLTKADVDRALAILTKGMI